MIAQAMRASLFATAIATTSAGFFSSSFATQRNFQGKILASFAIDVRPTKSRWPQVPAPSQLAATRSDAHP